VSAPAGFTRPATLGVVVTAWRLVVVGVFTLGWVTVTWGRLHPAAVVIPPILVAVLVLATVYRVALTRWAGRWMHWRRHRNDLTGLPDPGVVDDVALDAGGDIGVLVDGQRLVTMITLHPDPLAPAVVTDTEERTPNTISVARLAELLQLADVRLESFDLIADGARAAGGFADLYQQGQGPVSAAARRTTWLVLRMAMLDNVEAISRRAVRPGAARRTAAAACLRAADRLAAEGLDARPATAAQINEVNDVLHADPPTADHWSHLEGRNGFAGVYFADPAHIAQDAAQWWTWAQAREVTTLVRVRPGESGHPQIGALVRYRTAGALPTPPVSRLGPLYGVQRQAWRQFRVGVLPDSVMAFRPLANQDPVIPVGPTGPMIGTLPGQKAAVYLPLVAPVSLVCPSALLLRQIALRATVTGRPLIVVSGDRAGWQPIAAQALGGAVVAALPDALPADAIVVIDGPMPAEMPEVTVLTSDISWDGDITLSDPDAEGNLTLQVRTGLTARLRSVPGHEERRLLGLSGSAARARPAPRPAADAARVPAAAADRAADQVPWTAPPAAPRWGEPAPDQHAASPRRRTADPATAAGVPGHLPPSPQRPTARHATVTEPTPVEQPQGQPDPLRWPSG
jgi:type VII secretion protein EccE